MPDVSIVIVSFNTRDLLRACLRSVFASSSELDVVIVDNNSSDGSGEMIEAEFPRARLIRNNENRGFAAASNIAIPQTSSRYVLLLNPDTELIRSTLPEMVAFMDQHPAVGICGPKILYPDGSFQSCGYSFPTVMSEIRQSTNVNRVIKTIIGDEPWKPVPSGAVDVEWVDGACLMIRREVIDRIGLLDEQFFLYAEELDWCYNARRAGWKIFALPSIQVIHHQGKSSEQMRDSSLSYLIETRLRFYRKNYGAAKALLISLVYILGCLKQLRREPRKSRVKLRATLQWLAKTCDLRSVLVGRPQADRSGL